jgi:hypothetical protein
MNEVLKKLLLVITAVSLFFSASKVIPAISVGKEIQDSQIVISTKLKDVSESDIERVRREAEIALESIPPILGIEYKKKIKIKIVEKGICNARGGIISLPIWHVRNKRSPIVHEVTHIIAEKHRDNRFFSEGLAEFFQVKFGEDAGGITYYKEPQYLSLDSLVIKYKDDLISLYYLKHKNDVFRQIKSKNRKLAYTEAGSFIKFLFEVYGEHKLHDLYHSRTLDYEKLYGKNIQELESEWLNYVFIEIPAKEPATQYSLGMLKNDVKEIVYWFSLAAENGHLDSQKKLGKMYEEGRKVPQNYDEAIKWYTLAAYQGDISAQRNLGQCYIESNEDYTQAYAWLCIATEQGSNMAKKKRDEISGKMTPEQIVAANELIKEIKGR